MLDRSGVVPIPSRHRPDHRVLARELGKVPSDNELFVDLVQHEHQLKVVGISNAIANTNTNLVRKLASDVATAIGEPRLL